MPYRPYTRQCQSICSENYTIGTDILLDSKSKFEMLGFNKLWNTNIAMLNLEKIVANLYRISSNVDVEAQI